MSMTPPRGDLIIYADGSISADRSGVGIAICNPRHQILMLMNRVLPLMTSNEAEYAALLLALEQAVRLQPQQLEIRMDNEVVVNQMAGRFNVNSAKLKQMHQQACVLARQLAKVHYTHIPREYNAIADALATEASAGRKWRTLGGRDDMGR